MPTLRHAVVLECLQKPLRAAVDLAATLGFAGVQVDATGPLQPDQLGQTGRREFRALLRSRGLELAALGCPLRHGFDTAEQLDARVACVKKVLTLAYELGARVVIVYPGRLDLDEKHPAWPFLFGSLGDLARHGDRVGATLALETGVEAPVQVDALLGRFETAGLAVNLDPASLLMHRHEAVAAVRTWRERIAHVHARDARQGRPDKGAQETSLGAGDVDWLEFLGALEEVGYRRWLTLKRTGPDAVADLKAGLSFLKRLGG